jgi:hypothetical protein
MPYSPWFRIGGSLFSDEAFLSLSGPSQWGYLVLHGHALMSGGQFHKVGALGWFRMVCPEFDDAAVWADLEKAEMVRPVENGRWEVAGWAKHQRVYVEDPEKKRERNSRRPTTKTAREVPAVSDPPVERSMSAAQPSRTQGAPAPVRSASLSLSAAAAAAGKNGHQEKREGGAGGNHHDRDIQDLLHDLTGARPWEKDYGKAAVDLELNYGRAEAEEAMRAVYAESVPGRRPSPWDLVRATEVRVSRDRSKRKEQEQAQARRDRAKPKERETITEEEYARINAAANYREPGDE